MKILRKLVLLVSIGALSSGVFAQYLAIDDASNVVYNDGWQTGDNGGSGFSAWTLATNFNNPSNGGQFVSTSNGNGSGSGPGIDTAGRSWGQYANSGDMATASRSITNAVVAGQTISVDIDNGWIDNGGEVGINFFDGNSLASSLVFKGGDSNYRWSDSTGSNLTVLPFTDGGLRLNLQVLASGAYSMDLTRLSDNSLHAQSGLLANSATKITSFTFFNTNAGPFSERNGYLNSVKVIPEPATLVALATGILAMRRKKRSV